MQRDLEAAAFPGGCATNSSTADNGFPSSHVTHAVTSSPAPSGSTGLSPSPAPSPTTEGSVMGGDRPTSLGASNPHTPDRDSNSAPPPVPSPPIIPHETLQPHEAVTSGTDDPADDDTRCGSPAPHEHAADTVAPTPSGSQSHASGPGVVPQINANSAQTEGYDARRLLLALSAAIVKVNTCVNRQTLYWLLILLANMSTVADSWGAKITHSMNMPQHGILFCKPWTDGQ